MKDYNILESIEDKITYLKHHNKNYTKTQEYCIDDLYDYMKMVRENKLRTICFIDDTGNHAYYKTNAPLKVLSDALDDLMFKIDSATDFIKELENKGYIFIKQEEIESYGVYNL